MSSSRSCSLAVSSLLLLLMLAAVTTTTTASAEEPHHERILLADADVAHLLHTSSSEEAIAAANTIVDAGLAAAGVRVASVADQKKDGSIPASLGWLQEEKLMSGVIATQGDDKSGPSTSSPPASGEHGKSEGSGGSKEGEKSSKSCVSKEECHKKRLMCGKSCTMSAHTKCAAKCSKSCIPTCT